MTNNEILIDWLITRPCVLSGRIVIDVRGVWPLALLAANPCNNRQVENRDDFVMFITNLPD